MKCRGFICFLFVMVLVGCAKDVKSPYKFEVREDEVTLYNSSFSYNATLATKEESDVPFVVVVEGSAALSDSSFIGEPSISFNVLGGSLDEVVELQLNSSGNTYEGEFTVSVADTASYSTQTTMDALLSLTKVPNIHIHEIKNLEGQNCGFTYLKDKNELTYPDGSCRANIVFERTGGADVMELYRVSVHVEDSNTVSISVIPQ